MNFKRIAAGAAIAAGLAFGAVGLGLAAPAAAAPPTAEEWSKLPAYSSVRISPDGKHVAAVTSPDGVKTYISVWDLDNLAAGPKIFAPATRNWFVSVNFLKNDRIVVAQRQPYEGEGEKQYIVRQAITNLDGGSPMATGGGKDLTKPNQPGIIDRLPKDPRRVLIAGNGIYKLDVYTGATEKVLGDSDKYFGAQVDNDGEVRARQSADFKDGSIAIIQWIKDPATGTWDEHFRFYAKDREPIAIVGFTEDKNIAYLLTTKGRDKAAIFLYDIHAKKILEPAFEHKLFEASGVIQSREPTHLGQLLGFEYSGPTEGDRYWLDDQLQGIENQARAALKVQTTSLSWVDPATGAKSKVSYPDGANVQLLQWSDDRSRAILVRSGPNQPPEYYLLVNNQLKLLGRSAPWIKPDTLGETHLIQFSARDGLQVPAYLTTPPKSVYPKGPYPTIVLPHGGPWARDGLDWDSSGWTQYFASRGYVVLQPQFRGSEGWGQKLWRAGDGEWGQKMQDDMDDGAKYLIAQGIAAPDRIAMHGFSFGGYSAMAGAVRPNGIYQCTMAGAGVADLGLIKQGILTNSRWGKEFQEPTIDGLDPLKHAAEASVPILLYHGDFDHTVELTHSEKYASALKQAGKDVTFVKIPGLSHSAGDTPELKVKVLHTLEDYLSKSCGPGGL